MFEAATSPLWPQEREPIFCCLSTRVPNHIIDVTFGCARLGSSRPEVNVGRSTAGHELAVGTPQSSSVIRYYRTLFNESGLDSAEPSYLPRDVFKTLGSVQRIRRFIVG